MFSKHLLYSLFMFLNHIQQTFLMFLNLLIFLTHSNPILLNFHISPKLRNPLIQPINLRIIFLNRLIPILNLILITI